MRGQQRFWRAALPLLIGAAVVAGQGLDPQEVRLRAGPYFPKPSVTIQATSELVEIGVVVRDGRGHAIGGLTQSDFEVRDEGKRQEVSAFSAETFAPATKAAVAAVDAPAAGAVNAPSLSKGLPPRWVAMVFDDLNTPMADLSLAKLGAKHFLQYGLAANDQVAVYTVDRGMILPFTADAAKIGTAIDHVDYRQRKLGLINGCALIRPYDAFSITVQHDPEALNIKTMEYGNCSGTCGPRPSPRCLEGLASKVQIMASQVWEDVRGQSEASLRSLELVVDSLAKMEGSRVVLVASAGFLSGTLEANEDRIIDKALRSNVVINALDAKGLYTTDVGQAMSYGATEKSKIYQQRLGGMPKSALNDVMGNLTDGTGGQFFHDNNDLDRAFKELGMQPEYSYLLGIAPEKLDARHHRLKINLTAVKHASVAARKGYFASRERANVRSPAGLRRLDREVYATTALNGAPVTVSAAPEIAPDGRQLARLTFHVDIEKVKFHDQSGARAQSFHMIAVLFDRDGAFVAGLEGELALALESASYQRLKEGGYNADLRLAVPVGSYRLRTVVVEGAEDGRCSTATQPVEIR